MAEGRVQLELLLGKLVRDSEGAKAGRILSVRAEVEGEECLVREYDLGPHALLQRLGISLGRIAGLPWRGEPLRVPWEQMDLADPEQPRLRCRRDELGAKSR
jgi:hypothetical protein